MKNNELKIKYEYGDRYYDTISIDGLSVDEMNEILSNHSALGRIMEEHGLGQTYNEWKNGWGIYGIRHVGRHLFVTTGNNCD